MSSGGYFKGAAMAAGSSLGYANEACVTAGPPPNMGISAAKSLGNPVMAGPVGLERQTVQLFDELERMNKEIEALCALLYPLTVDQKSEHLANDAFPLQPANSPIGQSIYEGTIKVGMLRKVLYNLRNSLEL